MTIEVIDGESVIGGGAAPSAVLPTRLLAVTCEGLSADELSARLRASDPPIIARVEEGRVLLDLRTVFPEQDEALVRAIRKIAEESTVPGLLEFSSLEIHLVATLYTIGHSTRTLDELIEASARPFHSDAGRYPFLPHVAPLASLQS